MSNIFPIIGIETHVQLDTRSKLFCSCDNESFNAGPNVNICPVCSGQPGSLPVINKQALDFAILAGLALNSKIADVTKWDRKSYFYPDLPKGYQISQFDKPICEGGEVESILGDGTTKIVRLTRAHLEEDSGKSIHDRSAEYTFLDFNRCGTPLLEIVSEPDIFSAVEAEAYARSLRRLMRYIGVSRVNMEQGHMRFDVNVNLKIQTDDKEIFTPIAEVKNLNSFRSLVSAIEYEIKRQTEEYEKTGIEKSVGNKQTMLWNDNKMMTVPMRSKEEAADYRYFPDPDVLPVRIDTDWIEQMRARLPEMPNQKIRTYLSLGMTIQVAQNIIEYKNISDFIDDCLGKITSNEIKKELINWFERDIMSFLNQYTESERQIFVFSDHLSSDDFVSIVTDVYEKKITRNLGREWLEKIWKKENELSQLRQNMSNQSIDPSVIADKVLTDNQAIVDQYHSGKENVINVLIGKMMKESGGLIAPDEVKKVLLEKLQR